MNFGSYFFLNIKNNSAGRFPPRFSENNLYFFVIYFTLLWQRFSFEGLVQMIETNKEESNTRVFYYHVFAQLLVKRDMWCQVMDSGTKWKNGVRIPVGFVKVTCPQNYLGKVWINFFHRSMGWTVGQTRLYTIGWQRV